MLLEAVQLVRVQSRDLSLQISEAVLDLLHTGLAAERQAEQLEQFAQIVEDFHGNHEQNAGKGQKHDVDEFGYAIALLEVLRLKVALGELHTNDATLLGHEGGS